ncbi:MAG: DNA cytosine methyltransferase [Deltaproteobacteria bacterium]|nr:DNA cytosine methyltransferase [Deltaproteobacteria bacterium]
MKYETKNKTDNHRLVREEQRTYELRTDGKLARKRKRFRLIDAFAGAGGMTLGFSKRFGHAFDSVWANDFNNYCVETYNTNFGEHCLSGDIVDILNDPLANKIPEADVVIGGPPCQGFSLLNKNRQGDPRKQLWRPYFEIVERSGAKVFVMENVPQLLGSFEHGEIIGTAEAMGFKVWGDVLCAADYGVPQTRRRAFIIGCKLFDPALVFPPRKTHFNPNNNGKQLSIPFNQNDFLQEPQEWKNVRDAIEDLPMPEGTEIRNVPPPLDLHFGRNPTELSRKRYRAIPNEGMNRFDLQRIAPELTPKCWIRKKSGGTDRYLHPKQHRPITHREAARLQSFPDGFIFKGTKIEIAKQIGNAVPPLLAARVADVVYMLLTIKDH